MEENFEEFKFFEIAPLQNKLELKFLLISEGKSFKTLIFRKETILTEFHPKKFFNLLVNFRNALKALSKP
jgi:hypothetical protein